MFWLLNAYVNIRHLYVNGSSVNEGTRKKCLAEKLTNSVRICYSFSENFYKFSIYSLEVRVENLVTFSKLYFPRHFLNISGRPQILSGPAVFSPENALNI